jgi:S1-C subfamily serine protease
LALPPTAAVSGDDKSVLRDALILEEAMRGVIRDAKPAVACILVSRSDVYKRYFHDEPPADSPGKLGGFDASKQDPFPARPSRQWRFGDRSRENELQRYDLANSTTVPEAFGSGVVIDGRRLLVLTNYHVVRDATKVYVRLPGDKGSYADIHAADPRSDLAVLRLLDKEGLGPLKQIQFGDGGSVEQGQFVISLANPYAAGFRDGNPSASWGIISNIRRKAAPFPKEEENLQLRALPVQHTLLETDAKLTLGCSGGALLNLRGEMIGLTTSRAALTGAEQPGGFAVPIDASLKRIIEKLHQGLEVEYGFLGVQGQSRDGVYVQAPEPGTPAFRAGLQKDDCIEAINGTAIRTHDDLYLAVATLLAGSEARLTIRDRPQPVTVTLAKSYVRGKIIAANRPAPVRGIRVDYTSILLGKYDRPPHFGFNRQVPPGVLVSEVVPDRPAAAHLRVNDVITHVKVRGAPVPVDTPADFYREAAKVGANEPLELTLWAPEWQQHSPTKAVIP